MICTGTVNNNNGVWKREESNLKQLPPEPQLNKQPARSSHHIESKAGSRGGGVTSQPQEEGSSGKAREGRAGREFLLQGRHLPSVSMINNKDR